MKTKTTLLLLIIFYFSFSAESICQDLSGLSFCIDPGHGRGNTNAGPTGLREADINMQVALFLKDFLKTAQIDTVLLTRINDSTNPSLSQRETVANSFGVDWFHSVHHNAFNGGSRFTLLLYEEARSFSNPCPDGRARGTGNPEWPGFSDEMSILMTNSIFNALRTSDALHRLDWTFFGGCNSGFSLGVLNDLAMPGELSEGTFHDNVTEEKKLRNNDFLKLEARALYKSILDFYDAGKMATGALSGIVKNDDSGQPLNGVSVTLTPGDIFYTTDENNNGFFAFHDLAPATYQLTVSAADFDPQSKSVEVTAHDFSFIDFSLISALPPIITQTFPENGATNFDVYKAIGFRFSRPMNRESVKAAFTINPVTPGHFIWSSNDEVVLFEPDIKFIFEKEHRINITSTATDTSGKFFDGNGDGQSGGDFSLEFTTQNFNDNIPVVLDHFPTRRDTGIFVKDIFEVEFNRELDSNSVNENTVMLTPLGGAKVKSRVWLSDIAQNKILIFPLEPLSTDIRHSITLDREISLEDGSQLGKNFIWQFETQTQPVQFNIVDNFKNGLLWSDPNNSPQTIGHNPDSTLFQISRKLALSDSSAGELQYEFVDNSGIIHVDFTGENPANNSNTLEFGFYLYGDKNNNQVRLLFDDADVEKSTPLITISWEGWKLLRFPENELIELKAIELHASGANKGKIHFDDFFITVPKNPVSVASEIFDDQSPENFLLVQNYPNPFNPETTIIYKVPSASSSLQSASLSIYNLSGQIIKNLVQQKQPPGVYKTVWDGKNNFGKTVPSGLYIYQIDVGGKSESKKMILLK